jgi:hypothetical protein
MVTFAFISWRRADGRYNVVDDLTLQPKLSRDALHSQVKKRMRHFWESRMQRMYSFLGMPMKAKGQHREAVLAT